MRPLLAAAGSIGVACVAYGALVERRWYRLRREALPGALRPVTPRQSGGTPGPPGQAGDTPAPPGQAGDTPAPPGQAGDTPAPPSQAGDTPAPPGPLRVLHVSDLHLSPPDEALARFVKRVARESVDLVVATGDLLGAARSEDATVELLATLTADGTPGVAVLGSNDFYAPAPKSPHHYLINPRLRFLGPPLDSTRLRRGLADSGWRVLENERTVLHLGPAVVEIAGLGDPHLDPQRLPAPEMIASREPEATLRLGLVHSPYIRAVNLLAAAGYEVILAGHTHGGQIRLPLFGALVTNCNLPARLARGSVRWTAPQRPDPIWLHVSGGLGQSRYAPIRFGCRPEASLLELLR
ncbi:MAG: metallophosphoesterase [Nitriliruptorales bacterium]